MRGYLVGYDINGACLANVLMDRLAQLGIPYTDMGNPNEQIYPIVAERVACAIQSTVNARGLLICGTGIGMAITANKHRGIYAAVCHDTYSTERAVLSNNANVFCMGAQVIGTETAKAMLDIILSLEFVDGRSTIKLNSIKQIEGESFK